MTLAVEVTSASRAAGVPGSRTLRRWALAAAGRAGQGAQVSLRVVGPTEARRLNRDWRGRDYATNVLSFPAGEIPVPGPKPLGDIVLCASVVAREAREQDKSLAAHWAHLVVHGMLHLLGHDHEDEGEARRMERREVTVLRSLGFPNPYRVVRRG